ncbi:hypothetical protein YC2023_056020 [Brassica napus]
MNNKFHCQILLETIYRCFSQSGDETLKIMGLLGETRRSLSLILNNKIQSEE